VFRPRHMTPERLQYLLEYAWTAFYQEESQPLRMARIFKEVVRREMAGNTFRPRDRSLSSRSFGRPLREEAA
jgi:hypothetical protein